MCSYPNGGLCRDRARRQRMRATGEQRLAQLLTRFGGTLTLSDVAALLAVAQSTVMAKVARRELVTIPTDEHPMAFPCFQFDLDERRILPSLRSFLAGLPDWPDHSIVHFLLTRYDPTRSDATPLDLIRQDRIAEALEWAQARFEQRP